MSERVLHGWRFAGYVCRIVETEPGIVHFEQAQGPPIGTDATGPLAFNRTEKPLGCANEIIHLSQALAEANVINRDLSKAIQGWQEDRNRRENELARLAARVAKLEGENAKLRACVQPGGMLTCPFCLEGDFDKEGLRRHLSGLPMSGWSCDAARAEVDNG